MLSFYILVLAAGAVITVALASVSVMNTNEKIREDEDSHKKAWC